MKNSPAILRRLNPSRLASAGGLLGASALTVLVSTTSACSDGGGGDNTGGTAATSGGAASGGAASGGAESASGGTASGGTASGGAATETGGSVGAGGSESDGTGGDSAGTGGFSGELPQLLSETGLYASMETEELMAGVHDFAPQFKLWTDTADKRRWIYIPDGAQIDTSNMDSWVYPVGTRVWKEFSRDGVRVETRILAKTAAGSRGWSGAAYIWNEDQTDAELSLAGLANAKGTEHDVPSDAACKDCHGGAGDWPLGFGAVQLSYDSDLLDIAELQELELLSDLPTSPIVLPGTEEQQEVLGYLHANCGSCHRPGGSGAEGSSLTMWLSVNKLDTFEGTDTYEGLVNQPIEGRDSVYDLRVVGGDPDTSEMFRRFTLRGEDAQMPPMGTEIVDPDGRQLLEDWINTLPAPTTP